MLSLTFLYIKIDFAWFNISKENPKITQNNLIEFEIRKRNLFG